MAIIKLKNVSKFYHNKNNISSGFTKLNLELNMGEFVVITGESGSGKSTLLNVISGLDSYEEGEMYINGEETSHYTEIDYENYRRKYIGNIFQHFNLVNSYTVYQNIELVLLLNGYKKKEIKSKILDIIKTVGLTKFKNTKASKLSGGQKQRVAIARALAKDTPIIVADEPTGNLDVQSAKSIMKLLSEISKDKLIVVVTHNYEQVSDYATRKIAMNDGKIIEDKILRKTEECEAELVEYKDLTFTNKLSLGFRNAFNIKTKFVLLFLVYFFLTLLVFSEYSGLQKQDFTSSLYGFNANFYEVSPNRVILNKKDKTPFSKDEIEKLERLSNISSVVENDLILDNLGNLFTEDYSITTTGHIKGLSENLKLAEGRLPKSDNEVVVEIHKDSYLNFYKDELLAGEYKLQINSVGTSEDKIKVVGVLYGEDDLYSTIYVRDNLLKIISDKINGKNTTSSLIINGQTIKENAYSYSNMILPNSNVKDGQIYAYSGLNAYCNGGNCLNHNLKLNVSNIYFEDDMNLRVSAIVDANNYKNLLGLQNYDYLANTAFISQNDYDKLFNKGSYQISVFLSDLKHDRETLDELESMGYSYYYMRNNLVNMDEQITGIIKIIRNVVFIGATIALFFICYFIIKIILKSRNVYFSTIRILGSTKKIAKHLLNIELFIDITVAFLCFILLILLTQSGLINWQYINDLVTYFTIRDYIIVYVILAIMSLLISNRYAHKLFKNSVMNTYREEV